MAAAYRCDHPQCTGRHGNSVAKELKCPASLARESARKSAWHRQRHDNDPRYRARMASSGIAYREGKKRDRYVYAVLLGDSILKIGCSTQGYAYQVIQTRHKAKERNWGRFPDGKMVWSRDGDESLEIFLQWCASRIWPAMSQGYTRHTEWFNVTGTDEATVNRQLDSWARLAGELSELVTTSN